jgi:hypothetical protein
VDLVQDGNHEKQYRYCCEHIDRPVGGIVVHSSICGRAADASKLNPRQDLTYMTGFDLGEMG